jgi:hypothetical protein
MNKNLKNVIFVSCLCLGLVVTCEARSYFGEKENQLSIYVGQEFTGINGKNPRIEQLCGFHIVYSQPNTFFRLQGRQNFEGLCFFAYNNKYRKYNRFTAGLSQDIIIPVYIYNCNFFCGLGTGIFISDIGTEKISSRFMFGQKAFVGIKFGTEIIELFVRHFSNGDLTSKNEGYNFFGIAIVHNF